MKIKKTNELFMYKRKNNFSEYLKVIMILQNIITLSNGGLRV